MTDLLRTATGRSTIDDMPRSLSQSDSDRRELLDHVIVINERHLRRLLRDYVDYYTSGWPERTWAGATRRAVKSQIQPDILS